MDEEKYPLRHVQPLLDVILGVVIALPLATAGILIRAAVIEPSLESLGACSLLLAAVLFPTIYWFETRIAGVITGGVHVPPATFLVGSVGIIGLAAVAITFSRLQTMGWFLLANALFWLLDLTGTLVRRSSDRRSSNEAMTARGPEHASFASTAVHGAANLAFFAGLTAWNNLDPWSLRERAAAAIVILLLVAVRHMVWRYRVFSGDSRRLVGDDA